MTLPRSLRVCLAVALAFAALALTLRLGLSRLAQSACANEVVLQLPSPDGAAQAVLFGRTCGATTGYSTQLSVLPASPALPPRCSDRRALGHRSRDWASEADSRINGLSRHGRQSLLNLLAQSLDGTQAGSSQPEFGSPTDLGRSAYGDDPKDRAQIRDGYRDDQPGLWRIWAD